MRCLLPLLCLLLATPALSQPDWEAIDLGTTADLHAMADFQRFAVAGGDGFFALADLATPTVWTTRDLGTSEDLLAIVQVNSNSYEVAGGSGTYRFSSDAGTTWQSNDLPDATQDYVVARPNATWFALGSGGALYADLAGGSVVWVERTSGTSVALRAAESITVLMAFGDDGTILRADNIVGENWTPVASGTTADLHAVAVRSTSDWLVVGEGGLVLKSTDNGATWTPRATGTTSTLYAIHSAFGANGMRYLVAGEDGTLLETTDFGETWCAHTLPTTATLRVVSVPARNNWFVAGDGGVMLRSETEGGGTCTPVAAEAAPEAGYTLSAAWPNPTTGRAALALSVDRPQHVTASVVDHLGRRVAVVHDGMVGGPLDLVVERGGLAPGTYVVRVVGEAFATSGRITVLR